MTDTEAEKVRELRCALDMTQGEFALAIGMQRENVSAVENGRKPLPGGYDRRVEIATGLGFTAERLAAYLDGQIGLRTLLRERRAP